MKLLLLPLLAIYLERATLVNGIIGGAPTPIHQFPFAAAIHKITSNGRYFCGGALYTNQFIITAAQCVDDATSFTIQLGSGNLSDPSSVVLATSEYVAHPDYNPLTLDNDIGLIQLRLPVQLSDSLKSVNYLAQEPLVSGRRVRAIGWGQTSDQSDELAEELNSVFVIPLTNSECQLTYGDQITDNMVCVDGNFNEGACTGDTGSPLVDVFSIYHSLHVGVASFVSSNGCESTDPSGYIRTFNYVDWIQDVVANPVK